jgi:hypothetical protein
LRNALSASGLGGQRFELRGEHLVAHVGAADLASVAADLNRVAFEAGFVLTELSPQRATLQDRYLTLVDGSVA